MSTLEATLQALAMLEGAFVDPAPLLEAFGGFVANLEARSARATDPDRYPQESWLST